MLNKLFVQFPQDNRKLDKLPDFSQLTYSDAGLYVCDVSVEGIRRSFSFELTVEGMIYYSHFYYTKLKKNSNKKKKLIFFFQYVYTNAV